MHAAVYAGVWARKQARPDAPPAAASSSLPGVNPKPTSWNSLMPVAPGRASLEAWTLP